MGAAIRKRVRSVQKLLLELLQIQGGVYRCSGTGYGGSVERRVSRYEFSAS